MSGVEMMGPGNFVVSRPQGTTGVRQQSLSRTKLALPIRSTSRICERSNPPVKHEEALHRRRAAAGAFGAGHHADAPPSPIPAPCPRAASRPGSTAVPSLVATSTSSTPVSLRLGGSASSSSSPALRFFLAFLVLP